MIEKKLCCFCLKISISSLYDDKEKWICPHCKREIIDIPSIPVDQDLDTNYVDKIMKKREEKLGIHRK
ncbi:MAG: hypothetical protein LPK26_05405 [Bacillaceae bacterium]|nr:hypothetical protein [Bacillaceae bacterium]